MTAEIEYFYSVRSSFTYLGHQEVVQLARKFGRRLVHKPILLGTVVPATGGIPFQDRHPARLTQATQDMLRWGAHRGIPILTEPTHHYGPMDYPAGAMAAAILADLSQNDLDSLAFAINEALWRYDRDIGKQEVVAAICDEHGLDGAALTAAAVQPAAKALIQENNRDAIERGVIGAPTYVVDDEMFYGQDRLSFVAHHLEWERDHTFETPKA